MVGSAKCQNWASASASRLRSPTCVATQPPQQIPALGFPTIHTAVLRGCEQRLAIRGEGGEVDLEQSTEVVPQWGKKHSPVHS